jgi:hypothetical protein
MKYLLPIVLFLNSIVFPASAQNYSCVSPEYKTYFTNSRGYLRGMRIDSVRFTNDQKIYYPFRTARVPAHDQSVFADTLGGSWLGKIIMENLDGSTTFIPNMWGDTIVIKNNAQLNESWTFYHDSSSIYIKASVVAEDTITVADVLDSIKKIRLTVMDGSSELFNDSLNNLEIIITKEHGFLQAIDLYLFPYHLPDSPAYDRNLDMYLNESLGLWDNSFNVHVLTFKRVNYTLPIEKNIYNYNVGDVVIHRTYNNLQVPYVYTDARDSVITKNDMGNLVHYNIYTTYYGIRLNQSGPGLESFSGTDNSSWSFENSLIRDTLKMPEEWFSTEYYYFIENDTSFCRTSNIYTWHNHFLRGNGQVNIFEDTRNTLSLKEGLGLLERYYINVPTETYLATYLRGARKNGQLCGSDNQELSIEKKNKPDYFFDIYPNPAHDYMFVTFNKNIPFSVSIIDMLGNKADIQQASTGGKITVDISNLSSGMYLLKILVKDESIVKKIVVQH